MHPFNFTEIPFKQVSIIISSFVCLSSKQYLLVRQKCVPTYGFYVIVNKQNKRFQHQTFKN